MRKSIFVQSVFISYAVEDQRLLSPLCRDLDLLGVQGWHDHYLEDEQGWWDKTLEKIQQSDAFLMLISVDGLNSMCCQREYQYALALKKPLLALQVTAGIESSLLSATRSSVQMVPFFQNTREEMALFARYLYGLTMPKRKPLSAVSPLSHVMELHTQLLTSKQMNAGQQMFFFSQIKKALNDKDSKAAMLLLQRFRQRPSLLYSTVVEVDALLEQLDQKESVSQDINIIVCEDDITQNFTSNRSAGEQKYFDHISFVWMPSDQFEMGSPDSELGRQDDEEQHDVQIEKGFWMGQHAVTFEQYDLFCEDTQRQKTNDQGWGRRKFPVISVSWFDAVAYASWLSEKSGRCYRLPSEAEWEYGARAGTTTAFSTGTNINITQAHYVDDRCPKTKEVGSFEHNPWGLYDMHGNVWEWTGSIYQENYEGEELESHSGNCNDEEHTVRGGSWVNYSRRLRSAMRRSYTASLRYSYLGFRISLHEED
ncbi:MAG: SUMF1/EgtB/PvdO family nonheme iron enzyme [Mariprofundaceae bacterium]|nr:SUMF1/EgtB/PvdO family nonheme iron enzyme [Mariprofundaceae bacterium]